MFLLKRLILNITLTGLLLSGLSSPAMADRLTTRDYLASSVRVEHLSVIDAALKREDVRQQLLALGVAPDRVQDRIAGLPDADLAALAEQMEQLPAGGDSVLALVGAVFVVLLILELTGVINIFGKV